LPPPIGDDGNYPFAQLLEFFLKAGLVFGNRLQRVDNAFGPMMIVRAQRVCLPCGQGNRAEQLFNGVSDHSEGCVCGLRLIHGCAIRRLS
jgi:hypothetical protein